MRERQSGAERRAGLWPVALERGSADVCVCARVRMRVCVLACGVGLSGAVLLAPLPVVLYPLEGVCV